MQIKNLVIMLCFMLILSISFGCTNNKAIDPRELEIRYLITNNQYDEARSKASELFINDEKKLNKMMEHINNIEEINKKNQKVISDIIKSWDENIDANKLEIQPGYKGEVEDHYAYITGSVKNISNEDISYFEVMVKFYDDNEQVLDSDYTNDNLKLSPGEMREFEIMHKYDEQYKKFRLFIGEVNSI